MKLELKCYGRKKNIDLKRTSFSYVGSFSITNKFTIALSKYKFLQYTLILFLFTVIYVDESNACQNMQRQRLRGNQISRGLTLADCFISRIKVIP